MREIQNKERVDRVLGKPLIRGLEFLYPCPRKKCRFSNSKKLSVNYSKGAFKCWVCGWSGPMRKLGKFLKIPVIQGGVVENPFLSIEEEVEEVCLSDVDYVFAKKPNKYMRSRKITDKVIKKLKIGVGKFQGRRCIVMPSISTNLEVNAYLCRFVDDRLPKYEFTSELGFRDLVFNEYLIDWSREVVLVEGVLDASSFENSAPLLKNRLSETDLVFKRIVENNTPATICFDSDNKENSIKAKKLLDSYGIKTRILDIFPFSDPFEAPPSFIREKYETR